VRCPRTALLGRWAGSARRVLTPSCHIAPFDRFAATKAFVFSLLLRSWRCRPTDRPSAVCASLPSPTRPSSCARRCPSWSALLQTHPGAVCCVPHTHTQVSSGPPRQSSDELFLHTTARLAPLHHCFLTTPMGCRLGLAPAILEFWVRFPNERNQGKQAHPVLKYRVPHGSQLVSRSTCPPL